MREQTPRPEHTTDKGAYPKATPKSTSVTYKRVSTEGTGLKVKDSDPKNK